MLLFFHISGSNKRLSNHTSHLDQPDCFFFCQAHAALTSLEMGIIVETF